MVDEQVYGNVDGDAIVIGGQTPRDSDALETGLRVETGLYNKAAVAKATVLGDHSEGDEISVELVDGSIFSGTVQNTENGVGDRTRVTAYDAIYDLKRTEISLKLDVTNAELAIKDEVEKRIDVDVVIEASSRTDVATNFKETALDAYVEKMAKLTNTVWYVNYSNQLVIDDPGSVGRERSLERLIDVSAGKRSPAYQSVRVIGNSATSRRGKDHKHMVASEPVVATAGDGDPEFRFEDDSIGSQEQAQNVADSIRNRLKRQQKGGYVEVVGRNDLRPWDIVELPEAQGGESYTVSTVKHTVGAEGWKTRLGLGGLVSA